MDFVSFWILDLTVNSYGRKCLVLKLSCIIVRASAQLPFFRLTGELGENLSPQELPASFANTSVLLWFSHKESPCHLARWPIERQDGKATQGSCMAWGVCASTSKFIIAAIQNCLTGSSSLEICVQVSLLRHDHLLPPASTLSWPRAFAMS